MAEEDEIDILGDFSFDSCLAQNNQGIPSCSDREDTVHPQWLLDAPATNWYDSQNKDNSRSKVGPSRVLSGNKTGRLPKNDTNTEATWTKKEREILIKEMAKFGRNIRKISETLKTKTPEEIQALIDAEHGINLDTPSFGLEKTNIEPEGMPTVVQEEIVTNTSQVDNVISMVTTGSPTVAVPKHPFKRKTSKQSLLKPDVFLDVNKQNGLQAINPADIFYDDELTVGSMESVGNEVELTDNVSKNMLKNQKSESKIKPKVMKKIGNHRRKNSRNLDKTSPKLRNRSKDKLKSPGRQRKDSGLPDDSTKSPKMQIVFSSGQALPVSEGEQVIKIEKMKDSEPESDIEIDVDSDSSSCSHKARSKPGGGVGEPGGREDEAPVAVPLDLLEHRPRRQKKINLSGDGGYTISHSALGDVLALGTEPRRQRARRPPPVALVHCRLYNIERPAPFEVHLCVSALIAMEVHGGGSLGEVAGLVGGDAVRGEGAGTGAAPARLMLRSYRAAAAAASPTHAEMDPVSQSLAAEYILGRGQGVAGWHHSHPAFPAAPSAQDVRSQAALQRALERPAAPLVGLITSHQWPTGRRASTYKCIRVERTAEEEESCFQLNVKLVADVTPASLSELRQSLRHVCAVRAADPLAVRWTRDRCPRAGLTYAEKCISSVRHHLSAAGYARHEPLTDDVVAALWETFTSSSTP